MIPVRVLIKPGHNGGYHWHAYDEDGNNFVSQESRAFASKEDAIDDSEWRLMCAGVANISHEVKEVQHETL